MNSATSILFVVGLGVGTVFTGLICIIILTKIMSAFCKDKTKTNLQKNESNTTVTPVTSGANNNIENRQEIIAAVSAVIAETLGEDISALKILSFKKL